MNDRFDQLIGRYLCESVVTTTDHVITDGSEAASQTVSEPSEQLVCDNRRLSQTVWKPSVILLSQTVFNLNPSVKDSITDGSIHEPSVKS